MKYYFIKGKDQGWGFVNLDRVILVDFEEESGEIIFDNLLRIQVDKQDYAAIRKDLLKTMYKTL